MVVLINICYLIFSIRLGNLCFLASSNIQYTKIHAFSPSYCTDYIYIFVTVLIDDSFKFIATSNVKSKSSLSQLTPSYFFVTCQDSVSHVMHVTHFLLMYLRNDLFTNFQHNTLIFIQIVFFKSVKYMHSVAYFFGTQLCVLNQVSRHLLSQG